MTATIVGLADIKASMPVAAGNTDYDVRLSSLLQAATLDIQGHINRVLTRQTMVQRFNTAASVSYDYDLYGTSNESGLLSRAREQRFVLSAYPLDLGQSVVVNYDPAGAFTDPTRVVDPSLYALDPVAGTLRLWAGTARYTGALQVSYTGGYAVDGSNVLVGVDPRLALACITQTVFLYNRLSPDNIGMESDRSRGMANRASMVQKFASKSGLTPEAASFLSWIKPIAMGRD